MASASTTTKREWLAILPDQNGALSRRMEVRQKHLTEAKANAESGLYAFGGAMLDKHPQPGESPKINGSVMLAIAESKEEVLKALKEDVYTKGEVWDWDKVQIIPFISAIRKAL